MAAVQGPSPAMMTKSPAPLLAVLLGALLPAASAGAVEASLRLGLSTPTGDSGQPGPALGLTLGGPLHGRISIVAAGELSMHGVPGHAERRIDAVTALLGLEAGIDLAPIVPTISLGPCYQHAWRQDVSGAKSDKFGAYVGLGLKAVLVDHLVLGFSVRYLTVGYTADSFPAWATFALEIGWTSG